MENRVSERVSLSVSYGGRWATFFGKVLTVNGDADCMMSHLYNKCTQKVGQRKIKVRGIAVWSVTANCYVQYVLS